MAFQYSGEVPKFLAGLDAGREGIHLGVWGGGSADRLHRSSTEGTRTDGGREREPQTSAETETDRDRQRQTETDRDRQRQTETDRDRAVSTRDLPRKHTYQR